MDKKTIMPPWSIRKKLQVLLLLVFLPAVGVIVASGLNQRQKEMAEARSHALLMVKSLTAQQEQIATATETMLSLLAQLPEVRGVNAAKCNQLFRETHRRFPFYSVILAVTLDGNVFAASMPFKPGTINLADRKHIRDAIRTRKFSVGEAIVGRVSNIRSLNYTAPVFGPDGDLVAIVIVGFNLNEYNRFLAKVHPPEGAAFTIADWKGVRLFRVPESPTTAPGVPLPADVVRLFSGGSAYGSYDRVAQDGVARIYAFSQLRLREDLPPYLYMLVGIPRDPIVRNANLRMLKSLAILGISAVIALVAAWLFAGYILIKPINRLVAATRLFGKGAMGVRTGVPHTPDELGRLAESFDDTIALLEARDVERKRAEKALEAASAETELFLACIPSILIGLDSAGCITRWNTAAAATFGLDAADVIGRTLDKCGVQWLRPDLEHEVSRWLAATTFFFLEDLAFKQGEETRFLGVGVQPMVGPGGTSGLILTGADITQRKHLEEQLRQAQKLEGIGQLAAGIAHEINTPIQYVGDNVRFLKDCWHDVASLVSLSRALQAESQDGGIQPRTIAALSAACEASDTDYLLTEIPRAVDESLEGVQRVARIVRALKEFSHPGTEEKSPTDINRAIETTITVARNEYKYVADVETCFDPQLPLVPCLAGEFNQVVLNLLVNAAHAVKQVVGNGAGSKGKIKLATRKKGDWAEITVEDTGCGIPEEIRSRIFEPFFTTKEVGKGTGQGLTLAHTVIVKKHGGQIWFESQSGCGTTFFIRLPLAPETVAV